MIQISAKEIARILPVGECIDLIEKAMVAVSSGLTDQPLRSIMPLKDGNAMGMMPGAMRDPAVHGMKLISLYPDNPRRGLSSHQGLMLIFDTENGTPVACLDASELTALRTAAATAAATRALARPDSRVLAILGAGEQADHHLPAQMAVRDYRQVRVWTRTFEHARDYADRHGGDAPEIAAFATAQEAVAGADVIVTVTASPEPVLKGAWLEAGQHINLVGASIAAAREIDDEGVACGRYFVDLKSSAAVQAGEYLGALESGAITEAHLLGEIGEVYSGEIAGRTSSDEITIYKSLGTAAQDLAAGYEILRRLMC
ncbi:MAG: ornithine cyclodeaminase family protein [Salaquimonas sp.]|jgi:ornithine cyclodeaminase|nr:ornithine cyclodeaminase family protein [Salaquimonas sp.]